KDLTLAQLESDFDAIIMAAGTLRPNLLDIPGKELSGIVHGLDFLLAANHHVERAHVNETVIVIGGGFTAMDCARTIKRLGAKLVHLDVPENKKSWHNIALPDSRTQAQVLYRRSENEMLVTPGEVEELGHEGIQMHYLISPLKYLGENGQVTGMQFIRNALGDPDPSGRRKPITIPGSEFEVSADLILLATGQFPETTWIDAQLQSQLVNGDGWLKNSSGYETAQDKIFITGDFSTGAKSLIDAIGHAKECARRVDKFLMGVQRMQQVAVIEDTSRGSQRIREMDAVPVQDMSTLPLNQRYFKAEVELGFDQQQAIDEAQRCYQCHYKYEIDPDVCIYCNWCIKAKPQPDCIVEVSSLNYSEQGKIVGFNRAESSEDTNLVYINQEDCIRCHACVEACPVDAISVQKVSLAEVICADEPGKSS
ncbi:MAG: FAD-dependent oxidoreductase, partial [Gammaproteobacteria bacterium]